MRLRTLVSEGNDGVFNSGLVSVRPWQRACLVFCSSYDWCRGLRTDATRTGRYLNNNYLGSHSDPEAFLLTSSRFPFLAELLECDKLRRIRRVVPAPRGSFCLSVASHCSGWRLSLFSSGASGLTRQIFFTWQASNHSHLDYTQSSETCAKTDHDCILDLKKATVLYMEKLPNAVERYEKYKRVFAHCDFCALRELAGVGETQYMKRK